MDDNKYKLNKEAILAHIFYNQTLGSNMSVRNIYEELVVENDEDDDILDLIKRDK